MVSMEMSQTEAAITAGLAGLKEWIRRGSNAQCRKKAARLTTPLAKASLGVLKTRCFIVCHGRAFP